MNGSQSLLIFKIDVLLISNFIKDIFNIFGSTKFSGKHQRSIFSFIDFLQISTIFDQKFHSFGGIQNGSIVYRFSANTVAGVEIGDVFKDIGEELDVRVYAETVDR